MYFKVDPFDVLVGPGGFALGLLKKKWNVAPLSTSLSAQTSRPVPACDSLPRRQADTVAGEFGRGEQPPKGRSSIGARMLRTVLARTACTGIVAV
jgi:hypothetical protein